MYDIEIWLRTKESKALARLEFQLNSNYCAHRWVVTRSYSEFADFLRRLKAEIASRKVYDREVQAIINKMEEIESETGDLNKDKPTANSNQTAWRLPPKSGFFSRNTEKFLEDREAQLGVFLSGLRTSNIFMESGAARDFLFAADVQRIGNEREAAVIFKETESEWKARMKRVDARKMIESLAARAEDDAVAKVMAVAARSLSFAPAAEDAPTVTPSENSAHVKNHEAARTPEVPERSRKATCVWFTKHSVGHLKTLGAAPTMAAPKPPSTSRLGATPAMAAPPPPGKISAMELKRRKVAEDRLRRIREMENDEARRRIQKENAAAAGERKRMSIEDEEGRELRSKRRTQKNSCSVRRAEEGR